MVSTTAYASVSLRWGRGEGVVLEDVYVKAAVRDIQPNPPHPVTPRSPFCCSENYLHCLFHNMATNEKQPKVANHSSSSTSDVNDRPKTVDSYEL